MENSIDIMKEKFIEIKKKGWIKSIRANSTGVGATFENELGIHENQSELPDFNGIEIKTKRNYSKAYTSLFNCKPHGKDEKEIERLKNKYGYTYRKSRKYKVLNNSVFSNKYTKIGLKYYFKLNLNKEKNKLLLYVYDKEKNLIDQTTYWSIDVLKEKLYKKLKYLAFIDSKRVIHNDCEYFKYYKMSIYKLKGINCFIKLIEDGKIRVTFKIGVFLSGTRKGETHDHGTSFDIEERNLIELFELLLTQC